MTSREEGRSAAVTGENQGDEMITIVSIDGMIGSGKSCVLDELERRGYTVFKEELDEWGSFLDHFYSNPTRWAFTLQMAVLVAMAERYKRMVVVVATPMGSPPRTESVVAAERRGVLRDFVTNSDSNSDSTSNKIGVVFVERSPISAMIFARNGYRNGFVTIEELNLLEKSYDTIGWTPSITFRLNVDIETCYHRIRYRGRSCEQCIDIEYLRRLEEEYDKCNDAMINIDVKRHRDDNDIETTTMATTASSVVVGATEEDDPYVAEISELANTIELLINQISFDNDVNDQFMVPDERYHS